MSLPEEKHAIRTAFLTQRKNQTPEFLAPLGELAQARLLGLETFHAAQVVALYSPIRNEVPTGKLLQAALAAGKRVCFPCVNGVDLQFYLARSAAELQLGRFGVYEPDRSGEQIFPHQIDLMLIPGVAFDRHGYRLGYGRGYYDRILSGTVFTGLRVGLAYEFQLVERLPVESHDQKLDLLVTDKQVFSPSSLC